MKNSLIIVAFFICGILGGLFSLLPELILKTDFSSYALYVLMFFVGVSVGADKDAWKIIKNAKLKIILVPLSIIVGTFIGVGVFSFFLVFLNVLSKPINHPVHVLPIYFIKPILVYIFNVVINQFI